MATITLNRPERWNQIYSTNPLERLNAEIKRQTNVVGILPNDASITCLVNLKDCKRSRILCPLGCRQCHAEHVNLDLSGLVTYTTPRDIIFRNLIREFNAKLEKSSYMSRYSVGRMVDNVLAWGQNASRSRPGQQVVAEKVRRATPERLE